MRGKKLVTVSLLLFVAVSALSLIYKETRRRTSEGTRPASPQVTIAPQDQELSTPSAVAEPSQEKVEVPTKTDPEASAASPSVRGSVPPAALPEKSSRKVTVYYFYTSTRCMSCYRIENWASAAVALDFGSEMGAGLVEWKALNVDEPQNAHYVEDYQLFTKSVVISEWKGGREVRWKRLDKVWDLLDDESAFRGYVGRELRGFLGSGA